MADLLKALGLSITWRHALFLIVLLGVTTLSLLLAALALPAPVEIVQAAIWTAWLIWLGVIFPRNSRHDLQVPCALPYRRAFSRELLFGIALAFSQFLRPAVVGVDALLNGSPARAGLIAIGFWPMVIGGTFIVLGSSTLGLARTLFVYEYVPEKSEVVTTGLYRFLRHPLFVGGGLVSMGLALCTGDPTAITLGVLNACVVPVYVRLEDRRCCTVLGQEYADYRAAVGGVLPRWRSAIRLAAHVHHASGSTELTAGRTATRKP
jgi:protein-S-isoprenylcysteine O-methyltransferase Ste14